LQHHLAHNEELQSGQNRFYILDESSLASTKQMNEFLHRLKGNDRVLLVGDTRQHEAVEAGRPYQQLREGGIQTARLDQIVRQKDPALKEVVEQLARGNVGEAIGRLDTQGRVHEIPDRDERLKEIAREYAARPKGTLVVSPDNQSRREINEAIHRTMQRAGLVDTQEYKPRVLVARQEVTGADRCWAAQYVSGDVVRYTRGSKTHGIGPGEYARVERSDEGENLVTVKRQNGQKVTYDPRRLHGVTLYREAERAFSVDERVQFTAPNRDRHIANRELGTIEKIDQGGNLQLRLDSGRTVKFNIRENPHLDYGYAVTSHSSQGQSANPCGHRARRGEGDQSPLGIRCGIAWPQRRTNLHRRQITVDRASLARRVAPIGDGTDSQAGSCHSEDRAIFDVATRGRANHRAGAYHWALGVA